MAAMSGATPLSLRIVRKILWVAANCCSRSEKTFHGNGPAETGHEQRVMPGWVRGRMNAFQICELRCICSKVPACAKSGAL